MRLTFLLSAALLAAASVLPAAAQDAHAGHGPSGQEAAVELPKICQSKAAAPATGGHASAQTEGLDAGHEALMNSMSAMDAMGQAMMAPDIDVAFVCGMIPHHQGAIAMAKAEITHGNDPWAKKLAEKIIAAQEQEIAEMVEWLNKQAK